MMAQPSLFQLHLSCLRESCFALSRVSKEVLSDQVLARQLRDLTARLPGPPLEGEDGQRAWTAEEALHLVSGARASLSFLREGSQLSDFGERIAGGLRATLSTLEDSLGRRLRQEVRSLVYGLYVIIDPQVSAGREPLRVAQEALEGGARVLQLRDKGESLTLAQAIKESCHEKKALFIVNNHADLAAAVDSHGLHVGQGDLPVASARRILGPRQIVGRSNHLLEEALESERQGADYIAVGAMYPTSSKDQPIVGGLNLLRQVKALAQAPVVAIGGIAQGEVEEVVRAGADAVCVISAVGLATSPREAARRMVESIQHAGGKA